MALSPEQRRKTHEAGLQAKAEREAREQRNKPKSASYGLDYAQFRRVGLGHEEALAEIEKRKIAEERFKQERGDISPLGGGTYTGPRGSSLSDQQQWAEVLRRALRLQPLQLNLTLELINRPAKQHQPLWIWCL